MPSSTASPACESPAYGQVETMRALFGGPAIPDEEDRLRPSHDVVADPRIVIVDDQPLNIKIVTKYLKQSGYRQFSSTVDAREALALIEQERPDLVLLDIMMPFVSGLEILTSLRQSRRFTDLPVIILTAATDKATKLEALRLGATELLQKPIDSAELTLRLRNVLTVKAHQDRLKARAWELEVEVAARSADLAKAHRDVVQCLAKVGEFRDNDTGKHTIRVGKYAEIIAVQMGMDREFCARIRDAAPLHDIGKIGIPDHILLKPGELDEAEQATMRAHCIYGALMCTGNAERIHAAHSTHAEIGQTISAISESPILRMAAMIAYTHHERWDGKGYPQQLQGANIPVEGRITAVADVFDALTQQRPYKPAFLLDKSLEIVQQQGGTQFDPEVVAAFFFSLNQILAVHREGQKKPSQPSPPDDG